MSPPPTNFETLLVEPISEHAVLFSYNQPKISNAFTLQQYHDLRCALLWAKGEERVNVVVVTGKGKHFCAGKVLQDPAEGGPTIEQEIAAGGQLGAVLHGYPKILIAAVNGAAIGWGCTQLYNFDLVYARPKAVFQTPFMPLGFSPEGQSSWTFERVMGKQHANRLLIAGEKMGAREMYVSGLVTQDLGEDEREDGWRWLDRVKEIAAMTGSYNAQSLKIAKQLVNSEQLLSEQKDAGAREAEGLKVRLNDPETVAKIAEFAGREKKGGSKM